MTLVVSEVTGLGIVMVGDSAVTYYEAGMQRASPGVAKVQYAEQANLGFAAWGRACVGQMPMDRWLADFIRSQIGSEDRLETACRKLAAALNSALSAAGPVNWNDHRRGVHVAGFVDGLPHLYHVHTGGDPSAQHELRVFRDFPFGINVTLDDYSARLRTIGGYHLRNGYHQIFGLLFDATYRFTEQLPGLGFRWPDGTLENRVSLYRILVQLISDVLQADGRLPHVAGPIHALAFNETGLQIDQRGAPSTAAFPCGGLAEL